MGESATTLDGLRSLARKYLVPMSDGALGNWVQSIVDGTDTEDTFQEWLRNQAKSQFPTLTAGIDAGHDSLTLLDPYVQIAARELGLAADGIDMSDPKWMGGLVVTDPKTGERNMPTLDKWRTFIRTDPRFGWDTTVGAQTWRASWATCWPRTSGRLPDGRDRRSERRAGYRLWADLDHPWGGVDGRPDVRCG
jgi:hypothetical protein